MGLRGSTGVAEFYQKSFVNVSGMVNFDLSGYPGKTPKTIGIYTDNTDPTLTEFLRLLVDKYLEYGRKDHQCGYGKKLKQKFEAVLNLASF